MWLWFTDNSCTYISPSYLDNQSPTCIYVALVKRSWNGQVVSAILQREVWVNWWSCKHILATYICSHWFTLNTFQKQRLKG